MKLSATGRRKNGVQRQLPTTLRTYHNPVAASSISNGNASTNASTNASRISSNISSTSSIINRSAANAPSTSSVSSSTSRGASSTESVSSSVPTTAGSKRPRPSTGSSRCTRSSTASFGSKGSADDESRSISGLSDTSRDSRSAPGCCRHGNGPDCDLCTAGIMHQTRPLTSGMHGSGEINGCRSGGTSFRDNSADDDDGDDFEGFDCIRSTRAPRGKFHNSNDEEKESTVQPPHVDLGPTSTWRAANPPRSESSGCGYGGDVQHVCIDGSMREVVVLSD